MAYEKKYMERAIELAKKGIGAVNPNPLVGAVLVKDDRVIGEGYHAKYGDLHAERQAFKDANDRGENIEDAELYVTMEPCSHEGKQPPCSRAIIAEGIKRVYIGSNDPNPLVNGNGVWELRTAGIEVITGCMKEECDELNTVFFHYITKNIPYVVYKYAMTLDGKTSTSTSKSKWISCEDSRKLVQSIRNEYMGIMVGIGTVLEDDPSLMCHDEEGRNPIRIIVDSDLRIPMDSQIVKTAGEVKTYVASLSDNEKKNRQKIRELKDVGIGTLLIPSDGEGHIDLNNLMIQLGKMKIDGILLEGGGGLAFSMIEKGYVDEIRAFIAPKIFGGTTSASPVAGKGIDEVADAYMYSLESIERVNDDIYAKYLKIEDADNQQSDE